MIRIPLLTGRRTQVASPISGDTYIFDVQWNNRLELYSMDIYENNILVFGGLALVSGLNILSGFVGVSLPNIYCAKIGFPQEEIGFDDMSEIGYVVVDDGWLIVAEEEAIALANSQIIVSSDAIAYTATENLEILTYADEVLTSVLGEELETYGLY